MEECIEVYRDKLIEQKKRTIITRKEKINEYNKFNSEYYKTMEFIEDMEKYINKLELEKEIIEKKYLKAQHNYEVLERKYRALSNSKLGKITLKIWNIRKKKKAE